MNANLFDWMRASWTRHICQISHTQVDPTHYRNPPVWEWPGIYSGTPYTRVRDLMTNIGEWELSRESRIPFFLPPCCSWKNPYSYYISLSSLYNLIQLQVIGETDMTISMLVFYISPLLPDPLLQAVAVHILHSIPPNHNRNTLNLWTQHTSQSPHFPPFFRFFFSIFILLSCILIVLHSLSRTQLAACVIQVLCFHCLWTKNPYR